MLKIYKPIVAFEFGESSYKSYSVQPGDLYDYLEGLGFRVYSILGELLGRDAFVHASKAQVFWDYIACPENRIELIESAFAACKN